MVFAIELLIECRKGINIGANQWEYAPVEEEGEEVEEAGDEPLADPD